MTDKYNGWSNYETWAVHLWLTNEESSYNQWRDEARSRFEIAVKHHESYLTVSEAARIDLAETLKTEIEADSPLETGMYCDLLNAALSEVDWYEIANAFLEEDIPGYEPLKRSA